MTQAPQQILVPVPLAQQLLEYLRLRPWAEVHKFMDGLMQAPTAIVQENKS